MEIQLNSSSNHHVVAGSSPSSSSSDPSSYQNPNPNQMQSWWEAISKARLRIQVLSSILSSSPSISTLADSDRPARSLLDSYEAYQSISSSLSDSESGSGEDPLCQWLYETFQSSDPDLRLVVLSFVPLLSGLYLSRVIASAAENPSPSLAGFEAVLLSIYASETKARAGKPILISIPDLSQPSLYDAPRAKASPQTNQSRPSVGVLSAPLEPQVAVKSTKRACIVAVAFDCYYKQISQMPSWSKLELCQFAASWAGKNCACNAEFDVDGNGEGHGNGNPFRDSEDEDGIGESVEEMERLGIEENGVENGVSKGTRIPLPWELLQPVLRILGHCLLGPLNSSEVKNAASVAVRCVYARALHDIVPQAILATRSLIQLDKRARLAAKEAAAANAASNANTPSKGKKPEILLASK